MLHPVYQVLGLVFGKKMKSFLFCKVFSKLELCCVVFELIDLVI